MAQIRKGFIASNAIDGTKLKLLNNDAIRAANADGTDAELMKLDASNVLQFLKLPQVSSDPSVANDLARKSYVDNKVDTAKGDVDAALAAETSARQSADSALQGAIDTEKGRIDAILTAATADADSFAEIVNLINSVDTTNDQAFASYVLSNDAALAQEVSDRQSADSTLQSNIDSEASARAAAVSAEQSARESADSTLQSNIDSETASRQSADSALQDGLDQEVADREAAVSAEQSAREAGDASLQSQIDALDSGSSAGLAQEIADRTAADSALQAAVDQEVSDRTAAVSAEASARQSADSTLQSNIDTEKARIDAILTAATADADSFAEIVNLINSVDTENDNAFASYVLSNDAALAQEVSDRQAAVSAEQSAREAADSAEAAARAAGDSALADSVAAEASARAAEMAQEVADRSAADSALSADIGDETARATAAEEALDAKVDQEIFDRSAAVSAEQAAREAADTAETAAREAADSALDVRVDALEAVSHQKAKFTLTYMDIMSGYVELAHNAIVNSELVFVGSLYLHDGDHYTTSAGVSGTRLTWTGDVANGGASQLVEGDTVYVRYQASTGTGGGGGGGGGGGEAASLSLMSANDSAGVYNVYWYGSNLTGKYVQLQTQAMGNWYQVANLGPAAMSYGSTMSAFLSDGQTLRLQLFDDSMYMIPTSPVVASSTWTASISAGGGGGGGSGPVTGITNVNSGVSMMMPDYLYINFEVSGGSAQSYFYLWEDGQVGTSTPVYITAGVTPSPVGTSLQRSSIDPTKSYVITGGSMDSSQPYEAISGSFSIPAGTAGVLTQDGLGEGVGYIPGTAVTGLTRLTAGSGSAVVDTFSETTFFGYHLFGGTFSQAEIDEFTTTGSIIGATSWVGNGNPEHTWTEVPTSGNYAGAMLGAKQGEARVFFWQGRHILARVVTP